MKGEKRLMKSKLDVNNFFVQLTIKRACQQERKNLLRALTILLRQFAAILFYLPRKLLFGQEVKNSKLGKTRKEHNSVNMGFIIMKYFRQFFLY